MKGVYEDRIQAENRPDKARERAKEGRQRIY